MASMLYDLSADGVLTITGSETSNSIAISRFKTSYVLFSGGEALVAWRTSEVNRVILFGGAGNDNLNLGGLLADVSAVVAGGDGRDTIRGGRGNDTLDGGLGNDAIFGNNGNDILRGDQGNDTLNGGNGDDILLSGDDVLTNTRPARNVVDGGKGNNTLIASDNNTDKVRNIQTNQPSTFRPAGIAFPENESSVNPVLTQDNVVVSGRDVLVSFDFTLPNATSQLLISPRVKKRQTEYRFSALALITPEAGTPVTVGFPLELTNIRLGTSTIALAGPAGVGTSISTSVTIVDNT